MEKVISHVTDEFKSDEEDLDRQVIRDDYFYGFYGIQEPGYGCLYDHDLFVEWLYNDRNDFFVPEAEKGDDKTEM